MLNWIVAIILTVVWPTFSSQYTFLTYPDPRIDPQSCGVASPGHLCDPNRIIPKAERNELAVNIDKLLKEVNRIKNKSPACVSSQNSELEILVAIVEKVNENLAGATNIEKFTNSLKTRYQNLKVASDCDNAILIVNSKKDRQVYTVAGRDVKLTKDVLKIAFSENIQYFKDAAFAKGLLGMVNYLIKSYRTVHGPERTLPKPLFSSTPFPQLSVNGIKTSGGIGFSENIPVITPPVIGPFRNIITEKPENNSDKLWVDILKKAVGRCGSNEDRIGSYVQAVVEEAMSLSLRLIKDTRYTQIEESIQNVVKIENGTNRVWQEATEAFIDDLYKKYAAYIKAESVTTRCPARLMTSKSLKKYN